MRLGNFSVSLAVKDISASRAFYEKPDPHRPTRTQPKEVTVSASCRSRRRLIERQ